MKRLDLLWTDFLLAGAALFLLAFMAMIVSFDDTQNVPFDSAQWKQDDSNCAFYFKGPRQYMTDDLKRILLAHKTTKSEVEQLLGPPELAKQENLWRYRSGTSTMDCLSFDIVFDQDGLVSDARLMHNRRDV